MSWLNVLKAYAHKVSLLTLQPSIKQLRTKSTIIRSKGDMSHRPPVCEFPCDEKPCFDIKAVSIERGTSNDANLIRSFLYTHYWPREPSVCSLWISLDSPYLSDLSDKYSQSGDRFLAFERIKRTNEKKLVGICVANKIGPWMIGELEDWAAVTASKPDSHRIYFCAHCLSSPNLFKKYKVDYIYHVEVLGTALHTGGHGLGLLLLKKAIATAVELRQPLIQVVSVSQYTSRICEKCGMKREWTMDYSEFVDEAGQRVFYSRRPHQSVGVYVKYFDPKLGMKLPCEPPW